MEHISDDRLLVVFPKDDPRDPPAAIPPDRSGLSEFGMGMKSAACWFAPRWSVRTKALGAQQACGGPGLGRAAPLDPRQALAIGTGLPGLVAAILR